MSFLSKGRLNELIFDIGKSLIIWLIGQLSIMFPRCCVHSYSPSSFNFRSLGVEGFSHLDMALLPRLSRVSRSKVSILAGCSTFWLLVHEISCFIFSIFYLNSSNKVGFGGSGKTSLRVTGVTKVKNMPWSFFSRLDLVDLLVLSILSIESWRCTSADVCGFNTKTVLSKAWPDGAI